jgi:hypothetical protein
VKNQPAEELTLDPNPKKNGGWCYLPTCSHTLRKIRRLVVAQVVLARHVEAFFFEKKNRPRVRSFFGLQRSVVMHKLEKRVAYLVVL